MTFDHLNNEGDTKRQLSGKNQIKIIPYLFVLNFIPNFHVS